MKRTADNMASTTNQPEALKEKKRWRMSGLLGKNKDKDHQIIEEEEVADVTPTSASRPNLAETPSNRDSAYGSASNKTDSHSTLGLPTISQNQAGQTDAPVKIQTDRGTGRRVVVVTTTTKTEVFDTDGEGHSVPAGKDVVVRKTETDDTPAEPQDVGATRVEETRETSRPDVPRRSSRRSMSPGRRPNVSDLGVNNTNASIQDVDTTRNSTVSPNRQSGTNYSFPRPPVGQAQHNNDYNGNAQQPYHQPVPVGNNSYDNGYNNSMNSGYNQGDYPSNQGGNMHHQPSYSQNQPVQPTTADPVERVTSPYSGSVKRRPVPGQNGQKMGTLDSLKAAAAGIHGAAETIRGAVNTKIEERTGGSAEAIAAHQAAQQRGLQEIQTGQFSHGVDAGAPSSGLTGTAVQPPAGMQSNTIDNQGYAVSPLITQAQQGYQDNTPYLPDPLGEAPPNMVYSLGGSSSGVDYRHPVGVSPFDAKYGAGGDEMLDDSPIISPIGTPVGDESLSRRQTLYGSVPSKRGKLRNVLRRKSQRAI